MLLEGCSHRTKLKAKEILLSKGNGKHETQVSQRIERSIYRSYRWQHCPWMHVVQALTLFTQEGDCFRCFTVHDEKFTIHSFPRLLASFPFVLRMNVSLLVDIQ